MESEFIHWGFCNTAVWKWIVGDKTEYREINWETAVVIQVGVISKDIDRIVERDKT